MIFFVVYILYKNKQNSMNTRVKNLLKKSKIKEIYEYRKDGIYINYGIWKGLSLTQEYRDNSEGVERFLESLLDSEIPYRLRWQTESVIKDLKNNYPNYERF